MKFSAVAGFLLLSSAALAVPLSEENHARREANRASRRDLFHHQTNTNQRIETAGVELTAEAYSNNWAGAVLVGSGYTYVKGSFVVPSVSVPAGGDSSQQYCAAAWVGIDGDTCGTAILQTGVNICIQNGKVTNTPWYEWFPAAQEYWESGITINTGDTITAVVSVQTTSSGIATIINESNGQSVSYTFTGQTSHLCETNAEWIMEDLADSGGYVNFANFGSNFAFTDSTAITNGKIVDTTGATILDIQQNNQVLTSSSASGSTVTISYK